VLCEHKDRPHFAHGLCRDCYEDVTPLSFFHLSILFIMLCFFLFSHACLWWL
jgi:transcription factor IIIB subunit 2